MLRAAAKVSVGAVAPVGVARVKRLVQGELSVVAEAQVWRRLAKVLIFAAGDAPVEGKAAPGEVPVVRFDEIRNCAEGINKTLRVWCAEAPRSPAEVRNCPRPQAVAAVVTSLMTIVDDAIT